MERNLLKEIAFNQRQLFDTREHGITRDALHLVDTHLKKPHAIVVCGIRRCGKSTLLKQIATKHFGRDFFYLNFEDERLVGFHPKDFSRLHEVLIECFGEHKTFILDEIQNAPEWEGFVRRMMDAGFKFILTGSNASLLSREFGTKLTGRHVDIELSPFSFKEFIRFKNIDVSEQLILSTSGRAKLNNLFDTYRLYGGFPERLIYDDPEVLAKLYEDIIYRDVAGRHDIKNTNSLRELALYYMSNVATLCSFNKLKSALGIRSVTTVSAYTEHLEQAYMLSMLSVFDYSVKRRAIAPKKIFAVDTGLSNAVSLSFSKNVGALTENVAFLELNRRGYSLSYYKTGSGREVDFACVEGRKVKDLFQVSLSLADPQTRKRELDALFEAMDETSITQGTILTENETEEIVSKRRRIRIIPIARWLLGISP